MTDLIAPPHSSALERELLGMMLISNDALLASTIALEPDCFYLEAHKKIFICIESISQRNGAEVSLISLREELLARKYLDAVGGIGYIASLVVDIASADSVNLVISRILSLQQQRKILNMSININRSISEGVSVSDILSDVEVTVGNILTNKESNNLVRIGDYVDSTIERIEHSIDSQGMQGISSGYLKLDFHTDGWQDTDLIILAARPGMGKTSLALNFVINAAKNGEKLSIFSMEMGKEQLIQRMIGQITGINMRSKYEKRERMDEIISAAEWIRKSDIWITDLSSINVFEIKAMCKYQKKRNGLDMIVIDYLQLISAAAGGHKDKRLEQISVMTRELKIMAMELKVPIICLSQLSRKVEERIIQRPILSDLRDSGTIEQDADMVLFIYRPEYYDGEKTEDSDRGMAEIIIAKNRNGGTGQVHLGFKPETCNFYNLE